MDTKNKQIGNIPNLRFKGFEGEWEKKKLGEVAEINPHNDELPNSFIYIDLESVNGGILLKEELVYKENAPSRAQRLLKRNDILFQMVRPYQKNNLFFDKDGDYVASTGYAQFRTKQNSQFIFQYLHYQKFVDKVIERCTGTSYPAINSSDLSKIKIVFPPFPEQTKIASFLSLIDERIDTQMKTIEGLEKMVEELSKQIFLQKIGFDCSIWQKISLDKIGFTYSGLSGKTKEDFGSGKPYIQYKQVYESSKIDLSKCDFVNINKNEKQNRVQYGDILFTTSSETPEEVGMTSVVLDKVEDTYLNSFCFGFRLNSFDILNPNFARFLFRSNDFRKRIAILGQGSTRFNISKNQLMKEKILLPPLDTQHKIANFLSSIDKKLEIEREILIQYQNQKKYLLQNLFI